MKRSVDVNVVQHICEEDSGVNLDLKVQMLFYNIVYSKDVNANTLGGQDSCLVNCFHSVPDSEVRSVKQHGIVIDMVAINKLEVCT